MDNSILDKKYNPTNSLTPEQQEIMKDNSTPDGKLKIPETIVENSNSIKKAKRKKSNSTPNLKIFIETGNIFDTIMAEQSSFPSKYRPVIDIIYENLNRILTQIGYADEQKNNPELKVDFLCDLISMINANNKIIKSLLKNSSIKKDTSNKITKSYKSVLKQAIAWRTYTKGQIAEFIGKEAIEIHTDKE